MREYVIFEFLCDAEGVLLLHVRLLVMLCTCYLFCVQRSTPFPIHKIFFFKMLLWVSVEDGGGACRNDVRFFSVCADVNILRVGVKCI